MSAVEDEEAAARRRMRRRRFRRVARWTIVNPLKGLWWLVSRSFVVGWRSGRWLLRRRRRREQAAAREEIR